MSLPSGSCSGSCLGSCSGLPPISYRQEITHYKKAAISVRNVTNTEKIMILPSSLTHGMSSLDMLWKFDIAIIFFGSMRQKKQVIKNYH